jgi:hypothetical protein
LPNELISPNRRGAADSVRNAVGSGQKPGNTHRAGRDDAERGNHEHGLAPARIDQHVADAAESAWRSPRASAARRAIGRGAERSIATRPARCGIMATIVTFRSLQPDASLSSVGSQMFSP